MTGIAIGLATVCGALGGWTAVPLVVIAALVGAVARRVRTGTAIALVAMCVLGGWRSTSEADSAGSGDWVAGSAAFSGVVTNNPVDTVRGQRFVARVSRDEATREGAGRFWTVCIESPAVPTVALGDRVAFFGSGTSVSDMPVASGRYLRSRDCAASLFVGRVAMVSRGESWRTGLDRFRRAITRSLQASAPGDRGALLAGLLTGDDASLSPQIRASFYATGTSHVTAVSGSNLALIIGILAVGRSARGGRRRWCWIAVTLAVVWFYVLMIGLGPPAFRAALIATFAMFATLFGRKPDLVTLTFLVAALEVLWRPADVGSLSFQLSTVSALAIVLVMGGSRPTGRLGWLRSAAGATVAAELATAPILAATVGVPSPWSFLANVLIAPVVEIAFQLSLVVAALAPISGSAAAAAGIAAGASSGFAIWIVATISSFPGAGKVDSPLATLAAVASSGGVFLLSREIRGGVGRLRRSLAASPAEGWAAPAVVSACAMVGAVGAILSR